MTDLKKKTTIVQKSDEEIPAQIIAASIVEISVAMKKINSSRLKRSAIIILLKDMSGLGKREIELILNCLDDLEARWVKK